MAFEWDDKKNKANILKHGIDFNDAALFFSNPMLVKLDTRKNYNEKRWISLGRLFELVVIVVYTK